jgi:large subunit ribosomal protein L5
MRAGNMSYLKEKYQKEVIPGMKEKFGYKNIFQAPKITKVVLNTGFGRMATSLSGQELEKTVDSIIQDMGLISGQKPVKTKAKKAISAFKIRKGMVIGAKVTLRKTKMYDFMERLINVALPRTRDFRGLERKTVDRDGNLTIGIKEHTVFPEVSPEKAKSIFGLEIAVSTTAKSREEGLELLTRMGFPIKPE